MVFDLSAGDVLHIGEAVSLTVLAVEEGVIRFGLDTPEGASPGAPEVSEDTEAADPQHGPNGWEGN